MLRESRSEMPMGLPFLYKNDAMSMIFNKQIVKLRFQNHLRRIGQKKKKSYVNKIYLYCFMSFSNSDFGLDRRFLPTTKPRPIERRMRPGRLRQGIAEPIRQQAEF